MPSTTEERNLSRDIATLQRKVAELEQFLQGRQIDTARIRDAAITNAKIDSLEWDKGQGGTLTLGGADNGDGVLAIKDENDVTFIEGDKDGHHYLNPTGNELVRVDFEGFHAYDLSGNELVRVDELGLRGFDTGGVERLRFGTDGLFLFNDSLNTLKFKASVSDVNNYGILGFSSTQDAFYISSGDSKNTYIFSEADTNLVADDDVFIGADDNVIIDANNGDVAISSQNTNVYRFYDPSGGVYRNLTMSSNKTAIMPTKNYGYRALYCTESPEVWFTDFCYGKKVRKTWWKFWETSYTYEVSNMFMEVTEKPYVFIPTMTPGLFQVWGKKKGHGKVRFEEKTKEEFEKNNEFWKNKSK